jgi:hypothetical protein
MEDITILKKYIKGKDVSLEEEEIINKYALIGVVEKGVDLKNKKLRARVNKRYKNAIKPSIMDKLYKFGKTLVERW